MAQVGALEFQFLSNVARLQADMRTASTAVNNATKSMERAFSGVNRVLGVFGAALGAATFVHLVKGALDAQDSLSKLSRQVNISVEGLVGYQHAASLSGVETDTLTKGFKTLSTMMADAASGTATAKQYFDLLNITIKNSDGTLRNVDDVMLEVAQRFSEFTDGTEKTAIAVKLFGRAGMEMIPMLNEGREGIAAMAEEGRKLNPVTTESARQAEELNDNLERLGGHFKKVGVSILNEALGPMASIADEMERAAKEGGGLYAVLVGIANLSKWMLFGPKPTDVQEQLAWIRELEGAIKELERTIPIQEKAGIIGRLTGGDPDEMKRQLATLRTTLRDAQRALELMKNPPAVPEIEKPKPKGRPPVILEENPKETEAQKATKAAAEYARTLRKQLVLFGETSREAEALYDTEQGRYKLATDIQKNYIVALAYSLDREEKEEKARKRAMETEKLAFEQKLAMLEEERLAEEEKAKADAERQVFEANELERFREYGKTELQILSESYDTEKALLESFRDNEIVDLAEYHEILLQMSKDYEKQRTAVITRSGTALEKFQIMSWDKQTTTIAGMVADMTGTVARESKAMFTINKMATLAQIALKTPEAVSNSYAFGTAWGGPVAGAAMAAIAGAAMATQFAYALKTEFGSGVSPSVGPTAAPPVTTIPSGGASSSSSQTTIVNFTASSSRDKTLIREFVDALNEANRDGSQILVR